jgi:antitoxin PrlF
VTTHFFFEEGDVVKNIIKKASNCGSLGERMSCCKVESLISVDERGQMVLPKEMREKANIRPGDKLALVSWEKDGKVCCFTLIKVEEFTDMVRGLLGPMMEEMIPKSTAH